MWLSWTVLGIAVAQRIIELAIAQRNTRALLARGGREVGAGHYPLLVGLHTLWLMAIAVWVLFVPHTVSLPWLGVYVALQIGRLWVMTSLGRFWTTRIITVPDVPLVRRGPYRYIKHPNYLIVVAEILVLPLVFGAVSIAVLFTALNLGALWIRIRAEDRVLRDRPAPS
jgi:methyltransferase